MKVTKKEAESTIKAIKRTLREKRQELDLSLAEVGATFGFTRQRVETLENPKGSCPNVPTIIRMCKYYDLSLVDFFKKVEKQKELYEKK